MGLENRLPILLHLNDGSSPRRCSIKKAVLKNFAIFTGKHLPSGLQLY